jgi:hypothetical protein
MVPASRKLVSYSFSHSVSIGPVGSQPRQGQNLCRMPFQIKSLTRPAATLSHLIGEGHSSVRSGIFRTATRCRSYGAGDFSLKQITIKMPRRRRLDAALGLPRPERSAGRNERGKTRASAIRFRRLTLRSATGTPQRGVPTDFTRKIFAAGFAPPGLTAGCPWTSAAPKIRPAANSFAALTNRRYN